MAELDISTAQMFVLVIVAFVGGVISTTTGSGGGVLLFSVMTLYMPIAIIIPIHGFVQMCTNWLRSYFLRASMKWKMLQYFIPGAILGAFFATIYIPKIPKEVPLTIIIVLIFYTVFKPKKIPDMTISAQGFFPVGCASGILGILVGAIGPFLALFYVRKDLDKKEIVANKSAMQAFIHTIKWPVYVYFGFSYLENIELITFLLIAGALGTKAGIYILKWIPQKYFLAIFKLTLLLAGMRLSYKLLF